MGMNRTELEQYVLETYPSKIDYPWVKFPSIAVMRHNNKKCFAFFMNITKDKLGLRGEEYIDIVNLKCSPIMIGSFIKEKGIFPAYHMNKDHWITVVLDGSVPDEQIKLLVDISYEATYPKRKKAKE